MSEAVSYGPIVRKAFNSEWGVEVGSIYIVCMSSEWGGVGESALKSGRTKKKAESLKLNCEKPGATQTR